jgi:subtilisin-like proprotein convertase family protein
VAVSLTDDGVITSTINVPAATGSSICSVTVDTNITHEFAWDLDVTLTSPEGTVVTLISDAGDNNVNVFAGTHWDDTANPGGQVPYGFSHGLATDHDYANNTVATPLAPEEALSAFIGEDPNGTWTLTVSDDTATNTGTLNSWGLHIGRCLINP